MLLDKDAILGATDVKTQDVPVPEWGGTVRVRGLTGVARDQWEASMMERRGGKTVVNSFNARAKLLSLTMINDDNSLMFTPGDITALGEKSGSAIERIYTVAAKLSGVTEDEFNEVVQDFGTTDGGPASSG
jgi:hypothetical protein